MQNLLKRLGVLSLVLFFTFSCTGCNGRAVSTAGRFVFNKAKNFVSPSNARKFAADIGSGIAVDFAMDDDSPIKSNNSNAPRNEEKNTPSKKEISAVAAGTVVATTAASAVVSEVKDDSDAIKNDHWIKDNSNDIYLWNPEPQSGESIHWSGSYVQDGKYKYAEGAGTVIWKKDGKIIQTDKGSFSHGRHNGQFKHIFPSGNVEYSNWKDGVEISDGVDEKIESVNEPLRGVHYAGTYRFSGMKAYMLLETLELSSDRKSFDVKVKAAGDETVFLDYHIWSDGKSVKFFNSEGFNGDVNPSATPIEYEMWNFVQQHFGKK